jgi:phage head maturation protease
VHGAFLVARTREGDDALELVDSGIVDGFSVGFIPVREPRDGDVTVRTEASLREVSLVHSRPIRVRSSPGSAPSHPPLGWRPPGFGSLSA